MIYDDDPQCECSSSDCEKFVDRKPTLLEQFMRERARLLAQQDRVIKALGFNQEAIDLLAKNPGLETMYVTLKKGL